MDYRDCYQTTPDGKDQVLTLSCIPELIRNLINFGFIAAGTVALIFIIIAGFRLLRAGGDPKEAEGARQTLTYAIIGLILVLLSTLIVNILSQITGVHCITLLNNNFGNCNAN